MSAMVRFVLVLSWRNVWRNYRRSLVMLAAIVAATWAMIFSTALMRGMVDQMLEDGITNLPGYVQVHHPLYLDDPSIVNSMNEPSADWVATINKIPGVVWSARVKVPAVISSERESRGVNLVGIDPSTEAGVGFSPDKIHQGRYLEGLNDTGVVIGIKMAERLKTQLGHRVVLMTQDPDNNVVDRGFRVVGLYHGDLEAQELRDVYVARNTLQAMTKTPHQLSEIALQAGDYRDISALLSTTRDASPASWQVSAWYELDSYLGSVLGVMDGFVLVWVSIIFIALSFGLVNTLVMAVFERTREIGLILALGMRPQVITVLFMAEMLLLLGMGLLVGDGLAVLSILPLRDGIDLSVVAEGMELFGYGAVLTPSLTLDDMILANVTVMVLGALTSLIPSWRASRLDPVDAIVKT